MDSKYQISRNPNNIIFLENRLDNEKMSIIVQTRFTT